MTQIAVLADDWDGTADPVPYYAGDGEAYLDFTNVRVKPRAKLTKVDTRSMADGDTGNLYDVVICEVAP